MRPLIGEFVNVVDNKSMRSVGKGKLISYTRTQIVIESLNKNYKMVFDSRVHHFEGYEPPVMLIKDENGNLIRKEFRDESIKRC